MPKRVFAWKFYDSNYEKKFVDFLETLYGDSIQKKLNRLHACYLQDNLISYARSLFFPFSDPCAYEKADYAKDADYYYVHYGTLGLTYDHSVS